MQGKSVPQFGVNLVQLVAKAALTNNRYACRRDFSPE